MASVMWLASCGGTFTIREAGSGGGTMKVDPSFQLVSRIERDVFGTFRVSIRGRDTLVGVRWLPGFGSRLRVVETDFGDQWALGADPDSRVEGVPLDFRYELIGEPPPPQDTGAALDAGILRLFFEEHPPVDTWVEVMK